MLVPSLRHPPANAAAIATLVDAAGAGRVAVARELGDGVFDAPAPVPGFAWSVVLTFGTILRPGEAPDRPRVLAAAGHAGAVAQLRAGGATEIAYQPAGPHIPGELEACAALRAGAAQGAPPAGLRLRQQRTEGPQGGGGRAAGPMRSAMAHASEPTAHFAILLDGQPLARVTHPARRATPNRTRRAHAGGQ